jgi:hypothetical protein
VSIGDGSSHNAHFLAAANLGDLAIAHKVLTTCRFIRSNYGLCKAPLRQNFYYSSDSLNNA